MKLAKTAVLAALAATGASAQTNLGAQTPQASLPFVMTQVATFRHDFGREGPACCDGRGQELAINTHELGVPFASDRPAIRI
jgi:hypothetical protein